MFKNILTFVVILGVAIALIASHSAAFYGGYKVGGYFGYVKGVAHKFLPWRKDDKDPDRRRILPRPFNPGDAPGSPAGSLIPTPEEEQILNSMLDERDRSYRFLMENGFLKEDEK